MTDNSREENELPLPLGSYLQGERKKKELTLEEVAESTCVPLKMLRAIEENNHENLPAPVFVRGFLKIYAEFLGIDPLETLERYRQERLESSQDPSHEFLNGEDLAQATPFFLSARFALLVIIILALLIAAVYLFKANEQLAPLARAQVIPVSQEAALEPPPTTIAAAQAIPEPLPTIAAAQPRAVMISSQGGEESRIFISGDSVAKIDPEETGLPGNAIKLAANSPASAKAELTSACQRLPVNLHLRFTRKTSVTVSLDNQGPSKFHFRAGQERSWLAQQFISVNVQNGAAVEVTVNGTPLPLATRARKPLIFTLPADLT
ncbi:MAG: RodZ domain-containing protein [Thermodesulfobacteriota bacterium]